LNLTPSVNEQAYTIGTARESDAMLISSQHISRRLSPDFDRIAIVWMIDIAGEGWWARPASPVGPASPVSSSTPLIAIRSHMPFRFPYMFQPSRLTIFFHQAYSADINIFH
jgi:hypothetical protein